MRDLIAWRETSTKARVVPFPRQERRYHDILDTVPPLVRLCLLWGVSDRVFCCTKPQDDPTRSSSGGRRALPCPPALLPRPWPTRSPLELSVSPRVVNGLGSAEGRRRAAKMPAVIGLRRALVEPMTDLFPTQDYLFAMRVVIVLSSPAEECIGGISEMPMRVRAAAAT